MNNSTNLTPEQILSAENAALKTFVLLLGFDPNKVATALACDADNMTCKRIAVSALKVERDFSTTAFSQAGVDAANKFLDTLRQQ